MSNIQFTKATKQEARARIAIAGPAGSGKTYTSLLVAEGLAPEGRTALLDTEHKSADKYAGRFDFDSFGLDDHQPNNFAEAVRVAASAGYDVLIIDSLSHEWCGRNGCLELVDKYKSKYAGNAYAAWNDVTPLHRTVLDAIIRAPLHVIATMRSKTDYVQDRDDQGRVQIRKVGMAPVQRDGVEYEFDITGDLDLDHNLVVSKSRCAELADTVHEKPGRSFGEAVRAWLEDGEANPEIRRASEESIERIEALRGRKALKPAQRKHLGERLGGVLTEAQASKAIAWLQGMEDRPKSSMREDETEELAEAA